MRLILSKRTLLAAFLSILILFVLVVSCNKQNTEKETIIVVVEKFFDAFEHKDADALSKILLPEGSFSSIREENSQLVLRGSTNQEFIKQLVSQEDDYLESMSNPKVLIHGRIAVLWTNYEFLLNGKFSHRGVDVFSLLKTNNGWKIASTVYTVEKD